MDKKNLQKKSVVKQQFEWVACDLCGSENFSLLFKGNDYRHFSPHTFAVCKCSQCGLVCLNPRPKSMANYYRRNYNIKLLKKDAFTWLVPNKAKKIKKLKKSGRILDIGCGRGEFLLKMHKAGWKVYGNDISKDACDYIRIELHLKNLYNGEPLSLNLPKNYFDVITLWHVLEHLEKPRETLEKINKLLKDNGTLVIECPNFSSIQRIFFKDKWQALELPQHIYQFTPKIITKMLKLTGFEIYKEDFFIDPRVSFIDMKKSILRWIGIQKPIKNSKNEELNLNSGSQTNKLIWRFLRFIFNVSCLSISVFLNCINCKDLFRVYCKKNIIKKNNSLV